MLLEKQNKSVAVHSSALKEICRKSVAFRRLVPQQNQPSCISALALAKGDPVRDFLLA